MNGVFIINGTAVSSIRMGKGHTLTGSGIVKTREQVAGDGGGYGAFFRQAGESTTASVSITGSLIIEGKFDFHQTMSIGAGVSVRMTESYQ